MAEDTLQQLIDQYIERGVASSRILEGLDRLERGLPLDDPKDFPKTSSGRILALNKAGCERELDIIENNETSSSGQVLKHARKSHAVNMRDQAWARWEHHRHAQPNLPADAQPTRQFAHEIALWEAAIRICELEAEALRKRLAQFEKAEEQERQRRIEQLRWKGIGKLIDNKLVEMDGRKVIRNEQDLDVFQDDGSSVVEYLQEVKRRKRKKYAEKKAAA